MASLSLTHLSLFALVSSIASVASYQFQVGGQRGWRKPTGNDTQTYNFWASENRFHVGDALYFKYEDGHDSVLEVTYTDYRDCVVGNPISKFNNGSGAVFRLNRDGAFFFISGEPGHCKSGEKMVVRVMDQRSPSPESEPSPSPAPGSDDGEGWEGFNWGPPSVNSTVKTALASYFVTALGGFLIVLYLLT